MVRGYNEAHSGLPAMVEGGIPVHTVSRTMVAILPLGI